MKTILFVPIVLFIFTVSASAVFSFPEFPESPVHEQRKALYEKKKKVYGPKELKNEVSITPEQGAADSQDQVKEKDANKDAAPGAAQDMTKATKKKAAKQGPRASANAETLPPLSENLQKLKHLQDESKKKKTVEQPSAQPVTPWQDVVGTGYPQYPQNQQNPQSLQDQQNTQNLQDQQNQLYKQYLQNIQNQQNQQNPQNQQ
jgi:hypothetical protein